MEIQKKIIKTRKYKKNLSLIKIGLDVDLYSSMVWRSRSMFWLFYLKGKLVSNKKIYTLNYIFISYF